MQSFSLFLCFWTFFLHASNEYREDEKIQWAWNSKSIISRKIHFLQSLPVFVWHHEKNPLWKFHHVVYREKFFRNLRSFPAAALFSSLDFNLFFFSLCKNVQHFKIIHEYLHNILMENTWINLRSLNYFNIFITRHHRLMKYKQTHQAIINFPHNFQWKKEKEELQVASADNLKNRQKNQRWNKIFDWDYEWTGFQNCFLYKTLPTAWKYTPERIIQAIFQRPIRQREKEMFHLEK